MSVAVSDGASAAHAIRVERRPRRVPTSTYRLQFHSGFTFADARVIAPYLARLGVTDCYASPIFTARRGSTHGYDVGDYNSLSAELGGEPAYEAFVAALAAHGMDQVVDFVPNHMGIDPQSNPWWRDVLENGSCSPSARFFDIDWYPVQADLAGKLLLPILGDQYGRVLERGELQLAYGDGQLLLYYGDHVLPINPRQAPLVYRHGLDELRAELGEDDPHLREFLSILSALSNLPPYTDTDPASIVERRREKEVAGERLARLVTAAPRIRRHIDDALDAVNGEPGRAESFDELHALLEVQAYRLAYWRTALHEINYRRFFDINHLAGVRVEDPEAFEATHSLLFRLLEQGKVSGVRVDHPDGLFDPDRYFRDLQALARRAWRLDLAGGGPVRPAYVAAEKVLSAGETLPDSWAVHGTTGYNFLNDLNGLFVDPSSAKRLRRIYARLSGCTEPFEDVLYASKKLIAETALASELNVLAHALDRIAERDRTSRDFTLNSLRDALTEIVACFPVYRSYVSPSGWTAADRWAIDTAIARARRRNPAMETSIFDFLMDVLLPDWLAVGEVGARFEAERAPAAPPDPETEERRGFTMRFQQYTGPVQAKGLEDTAFYRYNLLLSLNEVGGDPSRVGRSADEFHAANRYRLEHWPFEMLATSTHDTKLGEDVRARLNVLSEMPDVWGREVSRWMRMNRGHRTVLDGEPAPDRNDEYRFYQVLVGAWPAEAPSVAPPELVERMQAYMIKSIKEAKVHTSWISDNRAYDEATAAYVERTLAGPTAARFFAGFLPVQQLAARVGMLNSLAQTVLKLTVPGVPDCYQGSELWDLNLVDPDNRRPVDFPHRTHLLDQIEPLLADRCGTDQVPLRPIGDEVTRLVEAWPDGRIKLYVTTCGLRLRRVRAELFLTGDYLPLSTDVTVSADVVAFARTLGSQALVVVVPRLCGSIVGPDRLLPLGTHAWRTSRVMLPPPLASGTFVNLFTGESLQPTRGGNEAWLLVWQVFSHCPVAILVRQPAA